MPSQAPHDPPHHLWWYVNQMKILVRSSQSGEKLNIMRVQDFEDFIWNQCYDQLNHGSLGEVFELSHLGGRGIFVCFNESWEFRKRLLNSCSQKLWLKETYIWGSIWIYFHFYSSLDFDILFRSQYLFDHILDSNNLNIKIKMPQFVEVKQCLLKKYSRYFGTNITR